MFRLPSAIIRPMRQRNSVQLINRLYVAGVFDSTLKLRRGVVNASSHKASARYSVAHATPQQRHRSDESTLLRGLPS